MAVGIVSVPRRDVRSTETLPLRRAAGRPPIYGDMRPIPGYSLRAAFGLSRSTVYHVGGVRGRAWSAGVRPADRLFAINGRRIQVKEDLLEAVKQRRAGDVVPVQLERAGKWMELQLPLASEPRGTDQNDRSDGFPTVIECALPFDSTECGGPLVDLTGRVVGITIARVGPHGGLVIPGDRVRQRFTRFAGGSTCGKREAGVRRTCAGNSGAAAAR
ncbi:PDZ domain-containing protein [Singulisphaera acidiphila]|uniref:PDZ domain-containing protein n=1 Tax=Singulisphaera acidiphila TaxID=466153 RepID=UPI001872E7D8|nr:PDZ domain-containing protein [Singulisphaera acidiphila]